MSPKGAPAAANCDKAGPFTVTNGHCLATTFRGCRCWIPLGVQVPYAGIVIFKAVGEGRPYPDHGYSTPRDWASLPPRPVRLDELVTTKRTLDLDALLAEDSTFFGDLFPHVVQFRGVLYLEDGLHRAVRTALHQRTAIHARVLVIDG